jgi:hypothetical protein
MDSLLRDAPRVERAELYRAIGLRLRYEKQAATGAERIRTLAAKS